MKKSLAYGLALGLTLCLCLGAYVTEKMFDTTYFSTSDTAVSLTGTLTNWAKLTTNSVTGGSANWVASGTTNSTLAGTASVYGLVATNHISFVGTNGLFNLPVLTTAQKNALSSTNGAMAYDSDLGRAQLYDGSAWHSRVRWDGDTNSTGLFEFGSLQLDGTLSLTNDVVLHRDAANILGLWNGANAQAINIYNTRTDASNYERCFIGWSANELFFGSQKSGTGSSRATSITSQNSINFYPFGGLRWFMDSSGFKAQSDNAYDIGASGATRPRIIYSGPSGGFSSTGTNTVTTTATGATNSLTYNVILYVTAATSAALTDNAGTTEFSGVTISGFTPIRLQPGGKFTGSSITYATGTASHAW